MSDKEFRVEVGQIWEVANDMLVNFKPIGKNPIKGRQVMLKAGEKIEIRYPYEWHFRTEDDVYFQVDEQTLFDNCLCIGKIWERVRFSNKAKLEEILRLGLYDHAEYEFKPKSK